MNMLGRVSKEILFDPISEIGIQLDNKNPDDEAEIRKLIGVYLQYPSTELAEIHSEAMRVGTYDLETQEETKKNKVGSK